MRDETSEHNLLCPSAPATVDAVIIGAVGPDGSIDYVRTPLPVTRQFLQTRARGGTAEEQFRFSSPCRECACLQWVDGACGLPGRLAEVVPSADLPTGLPHCAIRGRCRWFHQSGADACRICPVVTTRDAVRTTREENSS